MKNQRKLGYFKRSSLVVDVYERIGGRGRCRPWRRPLSSGIGYRAGAPVNEHYGEYFPAQGVVPPVSSTAQLRVFELENIWCAILSGFSARSSAGFCIERLTSRKQGAFRLSPLFLPFRPRGWGERGGATGVSEKISHCRRTMPRLRKPRSIRQPIFGQRMRGTKPGPAPVIANRIDHLVKKQIAKMGQIRVT